MVTRWEQKGKIHQTQHPVGRGKGGGREGRRGQQWLRRRQMAVVKRNCDEKRTKLWEAAKLAGDIRERKTFIPQEHPLQTDKMRRRRKTTQKPHFPLKNDAFKQTFPNYLCRKQMPYWKRPSSCLSLRCPAPIWQKDIKRTGGLQLCCEMTDRQAETSSVLLALIIGI